MQICQFIWYSSRNPTVERVGFVNIFQTPWILWGFQNPNVMTEGWVAFGCWKPQKMSGVWKMFCKTKEFTVGFLVYITTVTVAFKIWNTPEVRKSGVFGFWKTSENLWHLEFETPLKISGHVLGFKSSEIGKLKNGLVIF